MKYKFIVVFIIYCGHVNSQAVIDSLYLRAFNFIDTSEEVRKLYAQIIHQPRSRRELLRRKNVTPSISKRIFNLVSFHPWSIINEKSKELGFDSTIATDTKMSFIEDPHLESLSSNPHKNYLLFFSEIKGRVLIAQLRFLENQLHINSPRDWGPCIEILFILTPNFSGFDFIDYALIHIG